MKTVSSLFTQIAMPSNPYVMPTQTDRTALAHFYSEGATGGVEQTPATGQLSLSAKRFMSFVDFTDEVTQDSAVAILPFVRDWLSRSMARGLEEAVINGDTNGTHFDNDVAGGAATLPQKAFDGLRNIAWMQAGSAINQVPADGQTFLIADVAGLMGDMTAQYTAQTDRLVWIVAPLGIVKMIRDLTDFNTVDKVGNDRALLLGGAKAMGMLYGSPVVVSDAVPTDLHDTGVNTSGGDNDTTAYILAHRDCFAVGTRMTPVLEQDKTVKSGTTSLVLSARYAFGPFFGEGTGDDKCVVVGGNIL